MEKDKTNAETFSHPDGVEVKLTAKAINLKGMIYLFILIFGGAILFAYIWDEFSAFGVGYLMGSAWIFKHFPLFAVLFYIAYTLIQVGILYWFGGKNIKAFRWQCNWAGFGFYSSAPIALKYYRIALLLPGILLGLLPAIHGFCTGNVHIFFVGIIGLICSSADFSFWRKLRPFDDEDLFQTNKSSYKGTIIKRNYGRNDLAD